MQRQPGGPLDNDAKPKTQGGLKLRHRGHWIVGHKSIFQRIYQHAIMRLRYNADSNPHRR